MFPSAGKIYIGRSDGRIQQIDASGVLEGTLAVNPGSDTDVFDPSLDVEGGASDINRLVVVSAGTGGAAGQVTRLDIPLCATPPPAARDSLP